MDSQTIQKIGETFSGLQCAMFLVNQAGETIASNTAPTPPLPESVPESGTVVSDNGYLFYALPNAKSFLITEDAPGRQDLLHMTKSLIETFLKTGSESSPDGCKRLLTEDLPATDRNTLAEACGIPAEAERCVILLEYVSSPGVDCIPDFIPVTENDRLVCTGERLLAILKDLQGMDGQTEVEEYARALQETLQEEAGQNVRIGIGTAGSTLLQLRESYLQASEALALGKRFRPEQAMFMYTSLLSERLLASLPAEECVRCRSSLFNSRTEKLFTSDMLKMLETFFQKDLSISDTARTLFMHRNTLIYRLNKIQSVTGLDLRHFEDASCFQLLYKLGKNEQ